MNEQIGINNESIIDNQNKINELESEFVIIEKKMIENYLKIAKLEESSSELYMHVGKRLWELKKSMKHVLERLHQLEEKERERARADHNREVSLD